MWRNKRRRLNRQKNSLKTVWNGFQATFLLLMPQAPPRFGVYLSAVFQAAFQTSPSKAA